jgi:hypothetical protein
LVKQAARIVFLKKTGLIVVEKTTKPPDSFKSFCYVK